MYRTHILGSNTYWKQPHKTMEFIPIGENNYGVIYYALMTRRYFINLKHMRVLYDSISGIDYLIEFEATRGVLTRIPDLSIQHLLRKIHVSRNNIKKLTLRVNNQIPKNKIEILREVDVSHNAITKIILDRPLERLKMSNNPVVRLVFGAGLIRYSGYDIKVGVFCSYSQLPVLDFTRAFIYCNDLQPDPLETRILTSHILES